MKILPFELCPFCNVTKVQEDFYLHCNCFNFYQFQYDEQICIRFSLNNYLIAINSNVKVYTLPTLKIICELKFNNDYIQDFPHLSNLKNKINILLLLS